MKKPVYYVILALLVGVFLFAAYKVGSYYLEKYRSDKVISEANRFVTLPGDSEGKIRQQTVEENLVEAIIGLPANLFYGTGIPAAIAIFNKAKTTTDVLFIDASREFENGKNQNRLRDEDIDHIVTTYRRFAQGELKPGIVEERYAYVARREELAENDYNLNIPRYVDTFEEEPEIDIAAVQQEIDALEKELAEVHVRMDGYLKELGY